MNLKRAIGLLLLIALVVSFSLVAKDNEKADNTITCPVTGKVLKKSEAQGPVMHNGKEYYFACKGSMAKFKENPDQYLGCSCMHTDHDKKTDFKASHEGTDYYFCSEKCKNAFEKDPKAFLAQMKKSKDCDHEHAKCSSKCSHTKDCASKCEKK
ncbi:YHS domain-containing protein [candidate division KSB1 bacterium]|nr:YHS domain-containing protein [candidate division KSB1 bacterium]